MPGLGKKTSSGSARNSPWALLQAACNPLGGQGRQKAEPVRTQDSLDGNMHCDGKKREPCQRRESRARNWRSQPWEEPGQREGSEARDRQHPVPKQGAREVGAR